MKHLTAYTAPIPLPPGTGLFLSSGYALADAGPVGMLLVSTRPERTYNG